MIHFVNHFSYTTKMIYTKLIICIIILFIFYYMNHYLFNSVKEHYLTYFLPYYDNDKSEIQKFYENDDIKRLNYKKYFTYEPFHFGFIEGEQNQTVDELSKVLLAKSKIETVRRSPFINYKTLIHNLNTNKIQLSLLSLPVVSFFKSNKEGENEFDNIKYILKMYKKYLYILTKKTYKIKNLRDLPYKIKIGIISDNIIYSDDILTYLGHKLNRDFTYKKYNNKYELFNAFNNNEIHLIFYNGYFPDDTLKEFITKHIREGVILLPFDVPREEVFFQNYYQYNHKYIDLNLISESYLPVSFGQYTFSRFKPDMKILTYDEYLVTNRFVKDDYIYDIIKTYYSVIPLLNQYPEIKGDPLSTISLEDTGLPIQFHNGAYKFYVEKGHITDNPNPNCKYLVGVMECTDETLKNNNLLLF